MAATRIIPMHHNKGKTVAQSLKDRIDYAENGEKTEQGEFISSYACDPKTAEEEFMLSKREYFRLTGRAQTLLFLEQNGIRDYSVLEEKANSSAARFEELSSTIKTSEKRLVEIAVLRTHIINYSKTRSVYVEYRKSGYSKKFYEAHREEITLHKAAKNAFSVLPESEKRDGKLPTVKQLSEEYARVLDKKKKAYSEYREAREEMKKYTMAKHNIDEFMRKSEQEEREQKKRKELSR